MHTAFPRRRAPSISRRINKRTGCSRVGFVVPEPRPPAHAVREDVVGYAAYETEGSERRALGSIGVTADARWIATLTVPIPDRVVFVHLERSGLLPAGYRGSEESADFAVPTDEVGALVALLAGIATQARRDHVLPEATSDLAPQ